jgi:hypothetical protein
MFHLLAVIICGSVGTMKQLVIDNNSVEVTEDDVTSFLARKIRDSVAEVCNFKILFQL